MLIQIGKLIRKCRVGKTSSLIYETVVGRGATFPEWQFAPLPQLLHSFVRLLDNIRLGFIASFKRTLQSLDWGYIIIIVLMFNDTNVYIWHRSVFFVIYKVEGHKSFKL